MPEPELYHEYERNDAIVLFGDQSDAREMCDGEWIICPEVALCFCQLGELPAESHFQTGSHFVWVAKRSLSRNDDLIRSFLPKEVVIGTHEGRTIYLFVRVSPTHFLALGQLLPAHSYGFRHHDDCGHADFELHRTLPSNLWARLGGFKPGSLDHVLVDAAIARLGENPGVDGRFEVLKTLVSYWHGPIHSSDGILTEELADIAMPTALLRWYLWAGRRANILSGQNRLLAPKGLSRVSSNLLVFYGENQWCYEWATSPHGDDPPVYGHEDADRPWDSQEMSVSEHLILACLFEGTMCHCHYGASAAWLEEKIVSEIASHLNPVPIAPWKWCGATRFYAKDGAFMFTGSNGDVDGTPGYSVWLGAKTEHPLQFLRPYIDAHPSQWEYVAV